MSIKKKIEKRQKQIKKLVDEIKILQSECKHPHYEKGLNIMYCIQEVYLCTECGDMKPIQYDWFADDPNG